MSDEWWPIETAPLDGSRVHLGFRHMQDFDVIAHFLNGHWREVGEGVGNEGRLFGRPEPTHWRPLPKAPT